MSLPVRRFLLVLVGVLLLQSAWILAVPPFRGSDEFDHAFRAAGVASGQWHLTQPAVHGRGLLVWIPGDLAEAASTQCASQSYTGHDNCFPVRTRGSQVQVATAAGPYDPTYYWLMGTLAKPFRGNTALYAMRVTTALLCAVLLALGGAVFSLAGPGRWATTGVIVALTPQVLYSCSVAAPNGPEMCAGFLLWACLYAVLRQRLPARTERVVLMLGIAAAVVLTYLRFLGPLWLACVVGSVIAVTGVPAVAALARRRRKLLPAGVILVVMAGFWWIGWNFLSRDVILASSAPLPADGSHDWSQAFSVPLWLMQMVAAFPYREYPGPLWVYPLEFLLIGTFTLSAMRSVGETARESRTLRWIVLVMIVVPVLIALAYLTSKGSFWQGRYELPFALGILPTCGWVLDQRGFLAREGPFATGFAVVAVAASQVACVVHVMHAELHRPVSASQAGWVHPDVFVVGAIAVAGAILLCAIAPIRRNARMDASLVTTSVS